MKTGFPCQATVCIAPGVISDKSTSVSALASTSELGFMLATKGTQVAATPAPPTTVVSLSKKLRRPPSFKVSLPILPPFLNITVP
jgi:hypothetical protein